YENNFLIKLACERVNLNLTLKLLEHGADINHIELSTPHEIAWSVENDVGLIYMKSIIEIGFNYTKYLSELFLNSVCANNFKLISYLVVLGADIRMCDDFALFMAVNNRAPKMVT